MDTLIYIVFAAVLYGILADRTERAIEREMRKRKNEPDLHLLP